MTDLGAQMETWAKGTGARLVQALQRGLVDRRDEVLRDAQAAMPVATGRLRGSTRAVETAAAGAGIGVGSGIGYEGEARFGRGHAQAGQLIVSQLIVSPMLDGDAARLAALRAVREEIHGG